jgi:hypothetical protein
MPLGSAQEAPRVHVRNGQIVVEVDWDDADAAREHLRRHGLPGIVRLDPATREATIELWDEPDADRTRAVLDMWVGSVV